jgi:general secretion pathway protein J
MSRHAEAGVTLIEVLVSLALFALIAGAGVAVLDQVLRAQVQTEARLDRLASLQRMMHLVRRDLSDVRPASVQGDAGAITLQRPAETGLVQVRYGTGGTQMTRAVGAQAPQVLVQDVAALQWQYLDAGGVWHDDWPQPPAVQSGTPRLRAVAMTLTLQAGGQSLRRVVAVPRETAP